MAVNIVEQLCTSRGFHQDCNSACRSRIASSRHKVTLPDAWRKMMCSMTYWSVRHLLNKQPNVEPMTSPSSVTLMPSSDAFASVSSLHPFLAMTNSCC